MESSPKNRDAGFAAGSTGTDRSSVELVGFAADVLAALVNGGSDSDSEAAERAVRRYLDDARVRPAGWSLPPGVGLESTERGATTVVLAADSFSAIAVEAEAQGVPVEALVGHAVMYLWAAERSPDAAPTAAASVSAPAVPPPGRRRVSPRTSGG